MTSYGVTVYTNAKGETATGAIPPDAVRGFTPAKTGISYGPANTTHGCVEQDLPDQALHDHATFTSAELKQYNLPSAADLGLPFDEWATTVRATKHIACTTHSEYDDGHPAIASTLESKQLHATASVQAPRRALSTCIDFCGFEGQDPPSTNCPGTTVFICVDRTVNASTGEVAWMGFGTDSYMCGCAFDSEVVSYWNVPTVTDHGWSPDDTDVVTWVGLGGVNGPLTEACDGTGTAVSSLVQAGTHEQQVNGTSYYTAWIENCGSNLFNIQTLTAPYTVHAGDSMVAYVGSSNNLTPGAIYLQDFTQGWTRYSTGGPDGATVWPGPDGNSAECVNERRSLDPVGYHFWHLADWGNLNTHFQACRAWTNYHTSSIMGIGSMPGQSLINFRYYVVNGSPTYCESTQWFDSFDSTYGYTSYAMTPLPTANPWC